MATRDYVTFNPWKQTKGLPRLNKPDAELNGKIVQENGYTKFQWCPSDVPKVGDSSDELFYTVNKQYFRAEQFRKINKKPVLMSLGDSFTYGIGVRDDETWPYMLADKLGMTNWNMGTGGGSNTDMYLLFQQMITNDYIPDILCIMWTYKDRRIVSRNTITPLIEGRPVHEAIEDYITISNNQRAITEAKQASTPGTKNNVSSRISTQWEQGQERQSDLVMKSSNLLSIETDADYLNFFIIRSAIVNLCKARNIKVRETFLCPDLQRFTISNIVPVEGWRTGKHPLNPNVFLVDSARDGEPGKPGHFGPKTLQSIADYYLESLPSTVS